MARNPAWTFEEHVLAAELLDRRGWRGGNSGSPDIVELSEVLRAANFPQVEPVTETFRSPNSVSLKLGNLVGARPDIPGGLRATAGEARIVQQFLADPDVMRSLAQSLRLGAGVASLPAETRVQPLDDEEILVATEGGPAYVLTLRRERSRPLREKKIDQARSKGQPIACEVCGFDFEATYGIHGHNYIEVHHRTPLHISGQVDSTLGDLALLCANCHRMIHRGGWMPVERLAAILAKQAPTHVPAQ